MIEMWKDFNKWFDDQMEILRLIILFAPLALMCFFTNPFTIVLMLFILGQRMAFVFKRDLVELKKKALFIGEMDADHLAHTTDEEPEPPPKPDPNIFIVEQVKKHFPLLSTFEHLGTRISVCDNVAIEYGKEIPELKCDYFDNNGVFRNVHFVTPYNLWNNAPVF